LEFYANNNGILDLIELVEEIYKDDSELKKDVLKTLRIYELDKVYVNEIIKLTKKDKNLICLLIAASNEKYWTWKNWIFKRKYQDK
jgi:hypothetical protein